MSGSIIPLFAFCLEFQRSSIQVESPATGYANCSEGKVFVQPASSVREFTDDNKNLLSEVSAICKSMEGHLNFQT